MIYENVIIKLSNGKYKTVSSENINFILVKKNGEKIIFSNNGHGIEFKTEEKKK